MICPARFPFLACFMLFAVKSEFLYSFDFSFYQPLARILASLTKETGSDKTSDMTTQLRSFAPKITLWRVCQRLSVQTVNGAIINQVVKVRSLFLCYAVSTQCVCFM